MPQESSLATYAPRLKRLDGLLDPRRTAHELQRQVRALHPRPGTYLRWGDEELAVLSARPDQGGQDGPPGAIAERAGFPALATARGWLILETLQLPGRKPLDGKAFVRGQPGFLGSLLVVPTS
jgi:methionyl-tRNA formyltransferase